MRDPATISLSSMMLVYMRLQMHICTTNHTTGKHIIEVNDQLIFLFSYPLIIEDQYNGLICSFCMSKIG